jgi:hypothetical protein
MEQYGPHDTLKAGKPALIDGDIDNTDPPVTFTTIPAAFSCLRKTTPVELESELL